MFHCGPINGNSGWRVKNDSSILILSLCLTDSQSHFCHLREAGEELGYEGGGRALLPTHTLFLPQLTLTHSPCCFLSVKPCGACRRVHLEFSFTHRAQHLQHHWLVGVLTVDSCSCVFVYDCMNIKMNRLMEKRQKTPKCRWRRFYADEESVQCPKHPRWSFSAYMNK